MAVVAEPKAIIYIQDLTLADCQSRATDADFTVTDRRDDNDYAVRYINGACWMTQNLRLSGGRTLTSADSNVTRSWSFPSTSLTSGNSYTDARSLISGNTSYGGYYNYCAASAGTVCNSSSVQDATQDICPKGWRLPTLNEMSGITSYSSAFSPVYSGRYGDGSLGDTGFSGYWWSATADGSNSQYSLYYYSGSPYAGGDVKYSGFSVRCIRSTPGTLTINFDGNGSTGGNTASQQIAAGNTASLNANGFTRSGYAFTSWNTAADGSGTSYADGADYTVTPATGDATITLYAQWEALPTMQEFTLAQCQSLASDANYTLVDNRDGNSYTVRYANDNCWMTQNLRLAGGRTLTSSDSNVASSWEFPNNSLSSSEANYVGDSFTVAGYAIDSTYGGYYNSCAATAGTMCGYTENRENYDICPKGWELLSGSERIDVETFNPVYSGQYIGGSLRYTGGYAVWWTGSVDWSGSLYYVFYSDDRLASMGDGYGWEYGNAVRCKLSS